ncbi:MAG: cytochrome c family protein, partial [Deltaproteobacteria bacterium]|nr:cytochrome c family protein [Deltaproteobacteria bacterium]
MNGKRLVKVLTFSLALLALVACGVEQPVDVKAITSQPKTYVGSDTCKMCHLEHYDSWKMTQHSRMIQDAQKNRDVIVVPIEEEKIRADLAKLEKKLKVPSKDIYVPTVDEILYTIGSQWKQRYIVKKDGTLFISPIQYNLETHRWVNYHEADWDKRPWLLK